MEGDTEHTNRKHNCRLKGWKKRQVRRNAWLRSALVQEEEGFLEEMQRSCGMEVTWGHTRQRQRKQRLRTPGPRGHLEAMAEVEKCWVRRGGFHTAAAEPQWRWQSSLWSRRSQRGFSRLPSQSLYLPCHSPQKPPPFLGLPLISPPGTSAFLGTHLSCPENKQGTLRTQQGRQVHTVAFACALA